MSDIDFSILVGNLVENAMEACSKAPLKNRRIVLNCTADKNKLILDLKIRLTAMLRRSVLN